ncbi:hypothetical protein V502_04695 [Pseudogymnoascus sp. VKM F-4520 (FW-2644)]|nr:hypothetical protein V502_04695 [Pseudogymnoascus sp. VKM F-4520 (FW-2644)]
MYNPKTRELDFEEFLYVNVQGRLQKPRGWFPPLSNYLLENFGAVSVSETFPYIIVFCEDKVPPPSERPFKIAGMVAVWLVEGEVVFPDDIEMGQGGNAPWISLNRHLLADLDVFVIPKAKTLSAIMNEHFPDAFAISFVSHQIIIELMKVTDEEHLKRLDYLTVGFSGIQVKRQQDTGVTVPISCWDKKPEPELRVGNYITQGDWENGTGFQILRSKRILKSGTRVATTYKPFNNRFTNLKGFASNLLHSDDIRKVNELFWTDSFVTGPQQLASIGKRVCKVDVTGNDLFSDPNAPSISPEYGELVQGIYATSMPPINRQPRIQDGVCGAPIIRARKEELLNRPRAGAKVLTPETGEPSAKGPYWDTPLTVLQKRLPQEETTGEVAGFMDIQYGGDRLLCFADVVDGLVDDGWAVAPVYEKRKFNGGGICGDSGPSAAKRSRNK